MKRTRELTEVQEGGRAPDGGMPLACLYPVRVGPVLF